MSDASFASLNPTLLARKGGAKPAMRPQLAPLPEEVAAEQLEDLGWNDMGQDDASDDTNKVVSLTPAVAGEDLEEEDDHQDAEAPAVKQQQDELAERVLSETEDVAETETKPVAIKPRKKAKTNARKPQKKGRRAAFTLRLDPERHLKLRLAATMEGKSAQAVVTEALDALLADIEDIDVLAERMKRT